MRRQTADGSFTAYSEIFDEHYHSIKDGALKETLYKHIYPAFKLTPKKESYKILDICFGLGFNSLCAANEAKKRGVKVEIISPEMDEALVASLASFPYPDELGADKMISGISKRGYYEDETVKIKVIFGDAREIIRKLDCGFDIVFQDAFSPKKNPTLWTYEYFCDLKKILHSDGVITTYSTATPVRLGMHEAGFNVYKYDSGVVREGSIASVSDIENLEKIDMLQKQIRAPEAKALKDNEVL